jgi:hypothetical protein
MKYFKTFEDFHNSVTKALHNSIVRCSYNACIMKKDDMELAEQVFKQETRSTNCKWLLIWNVRRFWH